MSEPVITLDGLAIGYDGRAVLSGISLAIARSSFTAILGANGSGKSTLLKTLLGLQPPVAGRIHFGSPPVFGYVPQTVELDQAYGYILYRTFDTSAGDFDLVLDS